MAMNKLEENENDLPVDNDHNQTRRGGGKRRENSSGNWRWDFEEETALYLCPIGFKDSGINKNPAPISKCDHVPSSSPLSR